MTGKENDSFVFITMLSLSSVRDKDLYCNNIKIKIFKEYIVFFKEYIGQLLSRHTWFSSIVNIN